MNERNKNQSQSADEIFSSLLGQASPRRKAPERDEWEIRQAALAEWKKITGKRRERRRLVSLAAALLDPAVHKNRLPHEQIPRFGHAGSPSCLGVRRETSGL